MSSKAQSLTPPPGSLVRVYFYGREYDGVVVSRGPKYCTVRYDTKTHGSTSRKAQVYPLGTILSATNWGNGALTAWLVKAAPEPTSPEPETTQGSLF